MGLTTHAGFLLTVFIHPGTMTENFRRWAGFTGLVLVGAAILAGIRQLGDVSPEDEHSRVEAGHSRQMNDRPRFTESDPRSAEEHKAGGNGYVENIDPVLGKSGATPDVSNPRATSSIADEGRGLDVGGLAFRSKTRNGEGKSIDGAEVAHLSEGQGEASQEERSLSFHQPLVFQVSDSRLDELGAETGDLIRELQQSFADDLAESNISDVSSKAYLDLWKRLQRYSDDALRVKLGHDGYVRASILAAQIQAAENR